MKRFYTFLFLIFFASSINAQTNLIDSVLHQGFWRTYKIHVPQSYSSTIPYPLVIVLHGGGHTADTIEYMTNFNEKADSSNFIVVYPNGKKFLIQTWNAGTCCGGAVTNNIDDVGFIVKMINDLKNNYNIDGSRIYATGASNGGMLAYRLACEQPNLFAAIAPVATTMVTTTPCSPSHVVSVLHIHSLVDTKVPYNGGYGTGYATNYMPPVDSVLNVWAENNTCSSIIDTVFNSGGAIGKRWTNCSSCSEVLVYTTTDGGHSWPGGYQTENGDPPSNQINATELIWDFFSQHSLNCSATNIESSKNLPGDFTLSQNFPNPFNPTTTIRFSLPKNEFVQLKVFNMLGQEIAKLVDRELNSGEHSVVFDGKNLTGGVYFYKLRSDNFVDTKKIVLLK